MTRKCSQCSNYWFKDYSINSECKLGHPTPDFGNTEACSDFEKQWAPYEESNLCTECQYHEPFSYIGSSCKKNHSIPKSGHACDDFEQAYESETKTETSTSSKRSSNAGSTNRREDHGISFGSYSQSNDVSFLELTFWYLLPIPIFMGAGWVLQHTNQFSIFWWLAIVVSLVTIIFVIRIIIIILIICGIIYFATDFFNREQSHTHVTVPSQRSVISSSRTNMEATIVAMATPPKALTQIDECLLYKCSGTHATAKCNLGIFSSPDITSLRVGSLRSGEGFLIEKGAWLTLAPRIIKVNEPTPADRTTFASIQPGDVLYFYAGWGDGCMTTWLRGRLFGYFKEGHRPPGLKSNIACLMLDSQDILIIKEGRSEQWAKGISDSGIKGWVRSDIGTGWGYQNESTLR